MSEADGWEYQNKPDGGDCRKIVTLDQDGMCWVGIRAYNATTGQWLNGGEPERATVLAWKDLDQPARGRWINGRLVIGRIEFSLEGTGFTLKECGCTEGFCDDLKDGTCREASQPTGNAPEPVAWRTHHIDDPDGYWSYHEYPLPANEHEQQQPLYAAPASNPQEVQPVTSTVPVSADNFSRPAQQQVNVFNPVSQTDWQQDKAETSVLPPVSSNNRVKP